MGNQQVYDELAAFRACLCPPGPPDRDGRRVWPSKSRDPVDGPSISFLLDMWGVIADAALRYSNHRVTPDEIAQRAVTDLLGALDVAGLRGDEGNGHAPELREIKRQAQTIATNAALNLLDKAKTQTGDSAAWVGFASDLVTGTGDETPDALYDRLYAEAVHGFTTDPGTGAIRPLDSEALEAWQVLYSSAMPGTLHEQEKDETERRAMWRRWLDEYPGPKDHVTAFKLFYGIDGPVALTPEESAARLGSLADHEETLAELWEIPVVAVRERLADLWAFPVENIQTLLAETWGCRAPITDLTGPFNGRAHEQARRYRQGEPEYVRELEQHEIAARLGRSERMVQRYVKAVREYLDGHRDVKDAFPNRDISDELARDRMRLEGRAAEARRNGRRRLAGKLDARADAIRLQANTLKPFAATGDVATLPPGLSDCAPFLRRWRANVDWWRTDIPRYADPRDDNKRLSYMAAKANREAPEFTGAVFDVTLRWDAAGEQDWQRESEPVTLDALQGRTATIARQLSGAWEHGFKGFDATGFLHRRISIEGSDLEACEAEAWKRAPELFPGYTVYRVALAKARFTDPGPRRANGSAGISWRPRVKIRRPSTGHSVHWWHPYLQDGTGPVFDPRIDHGDGPSPTDLVWKRMIQEYHAEQRMQHYRKRSEQAGA